MKRWLVLFSLVLLATLLLWADSVTDVRPTSDSSDSASWTDGTTACTSVDCSLKVNDSSGSTCSSCASDGNGGYIESATASAAQTFNINSSGIPAGATIQSAAVRSCAEKTVAQGVNLVHKFCLDGSCTNGAGVALTNGTYTDNSESLDPADTASWTNLQIGVQLSAARNSRVSCLEADVTYALGGGPKRVYITRAGGRSRATRTTN